MGKLDQKHEMLIQALSTLEKANDTLTVFTKEGVSHNPHLDYEEEYRGLRDSAIQRFEYSVDLFWKYLQLYLQDVIEITDVHGPKPVIRKCFSLGLIKEEDAEKALDMIKDRNMTSHIYVEEIAEHIASKVSLYYNVMHHVAENLKPKNK